MIERIIKLLRILREGLALLIARIRFGSSAFPNGTRLGLRVRIQQTDGGRLSFGNDCTIDSDVRLIVKQGVLSFGSKSFIGTGSVVVARESILIGSGALIGEYVSIRDQDHALNFRDRRKNNGFTSSPIVIGDNVWLGAKVTITQGVTIGSNVVVGANSVVTRDLPCNCVAAGAPARVIKLLNAD